jgi:uncharacterized protein (TIGR00725 family)
MAERVVSVIGGSAATDEQIAWAEAVGRLLAKNDIVLVCGGLGGIMEAACRGAKAAGGMTIGILPSADRNDANPFVDIPIVTGIGYARNAAVAYSGQAVIAIGGSSGTLSEIAYATVKRIPVVTLDSWDLSERALSHDVRPVAASSPEDAVEKVMALLGG